MLHSVISKRLSLEQLSKLHWRSLTSVLSEKEALDRLKKSGNESCLAFYSSIINGIIKEPGLMSVPVDDHIVHRGHGVFDTAIVKNGKVYQLMQHLNRFEQSARGCQLWKDDDQYFTQENLKGIILDTIRAAGARDQLVRYLLGSGPGGIDVSPKECPVPSFYVFTVDFIDLDAEMYKKGVKVITSSIPMKTKPFCTWKTTNYLSNVLSVIEAEKEGAYRGVWVDTDGFVVETATNNLGLWSTFTTLFPTPWSPGFVIEGKLIVPTFEKTLPGITIQRMMHLAKTQLGMEVMQRPVHISEAKGCSEAFLCGGKVGGLSITQWDQQMINFGKVGPIAKSVRKLFLEDMKHGFGDGINQLTNEGAREAFSLQNRYCHSFQRDKYIRLVEQFRLSKNESTLALYLIEIREANMESIQAIKAKGVHADFTPFQTVNNEIFALLQIMHDAERHEFCSNFLMMILDKVVFNLILVEAYIHIAVIQDNIRIFIIKLLHVDSILWIVAKMAAGA